MARPEVRGTFSQSGPRRPAAFARLARTLGAANQQPRASVATACSRSYNIRVRITYDASKREKTLAERGLDFEDAAVVFEGTTVEIEDERKDYGERRIVCFGVLDGRMVVVGYTPRGQARHVFSMRKANDREQARLAHILGL